MATAGAARMVHAPAVGSGSQLCVAAAGMGRESCPPGHHAALGAELAEWMSAPLSTGRGVSTRCGERTTLSVGLVDCATWHAGSAGNKAINATSGALSPWRRSPALEQQALTACRGTRRTSRRNPSSGNHNGNGNLNRLVFTVLSGESSNEVTTAAGVSSENSTVSDVNGKESDKLDRPPPGCSRIKVDISRPLGLVLRDDPAGNIWVDEVVPNSNADKTSLVDVGDQLIATSAVVYTMIEDYNGVKVRKGMEVVRLNVRGEKFDTVMAAIGTHPGYMKVTLELQKCKPLVNGVGRMN